MDVVAWYFARLDLSTKCTRDYAEALLKRNTSPMTTMVITNSRFPMSNHNAYLVLIQGGDKEGTTESLLRAHHLVVLDWTDSSDEQTLRGTTHHLVARLASRTTRYTYH
jgi:hypothetical protein